MKARKKPRPRKLTPEEEAKAAELYAGGMYVRAVGELFNSSVSVVYSACEHEGVEKRGRADEGVMHAKFKELHAEKVYDEELGRERRRTPTELAALLKRKRKTIYWYYKMAGLPVREPEEEADGALQATG